MRPNSEELQRYHDGELEPREAALVQRALSESPEARAYLRELEALGDAVRAFADSHVPEGLDLAGPILERIGREGEGVAPPHATGPRGRWLRLAPPLGLVLAAAAAVLVYLRVPPEVRPPAPGASAAASGAAQGAEEIAVVEAPAVVEDEEPGAAIEAVDFGNQNGTIFMVASGMQATPVVWLVDEGEPSGDRMKPL